MGTALVPVTTAETILQTELKIAHELARMYCGIEFKKPSLCVPALGMGSDRTNWIKPKFLGPNYMLFSVTNHIYVSDGLVRFSEASGWKDERASALRVLCFCHECVHSMQYQMNPESWPTRMENREKYFIGNTFCEGLADYLAIEVCLATGNAFAKESVRSRMEKLEDEFMNFWVSLCSRFAVPPEKLRQEFLGYVLMWISEEEDWDTIQKFGYTIGRRFLSGLQPDARDIKNIILNPPRTVREIIFPNEYDFQA